MKLLNEYHPETHAYTVTTPATPHPKKPGEYLARANSTDKELPKYGEKEWPVFNKAKDDWEVKANFVGTTYYIRNADDQIESVTIKQLGDVVPENGYLNVEDIPKTQAEKEVDVRAERDGLLAQADIIINKAEDAGKDTTAMRQYRQALRDVPEQSGFPDSIVWPEVPA